MQIPGYKIKRVLGKGGMATVYLATHELLNRQVALKVMNAALVHTPGFSERFLNEGRIVASLNHSNIITIYDIAIVKHLHFISMEHVNRGDLSQRIETGINPQDAIDILIKLADCLHFAHQNGVIHRDVKPANILFRDDATPLLTDFGIAKQSGTDASLTATGTIMGTPQYMSTEQAQSHPFDHRADIYSLGIIFYEMLTGVQPYQAASAIDVIIKHLQQPIPTLPADLAHLQPLLEQMIAKRPDDRFADAQKLSNYAKKIHAGKSAYITINNPLARIENIQKHAIEITKKSKKNIRTIIKRFANTDKRQPQKATSSKPAASRKQALLQIKKHWPIAVTGALITLVLSLLLVHEDPTPNKSSEHTSRQTPSLQRTQKAQQSKNKNENNPLVTTTSKTKAASEIADQIWVPTPITSSATEIKQTNIHNANTAVIPKTIATPENATETPVASTITPTIPITNDQQAWNEPITPTTSNKQQSPDNDSDWPSPSNDNDVQPQEPAQIPVKATVSAPPPTIQTLLSNAKACIQRMSLSTPKQNNAFYYYRQVLLADPDNSEAIRGLDIIAERYFTLAEVQLANRNYKKAKNFIVKGLRVAPHHDKLLVLQLVIEDKINN